jgi:protein SCO1
LRRSLRCFAGLASVASLLVLSVAILATTGCHSSAPVVPPAVGELKTFSIRGRIVSVDATKGSVLLDHQAVPGFMDAMTMSYKLKDPAVASELHPGDRIVAKLLVTKVGDGYADPKLDEVDVIAQAKPDYKPPVDYHVPAQGDTVPDFKLINQNGQAIHLEQFKGRVLLLTFIYTRCPLADFCPRMNRNFAEIDKSLQADPALYAKTHLLSISFDPKNDTPAVLKSYGAAYIGPSVKGKFAHWDFAAPPVDELAAMTLFFDVGVTPGDSGTLNHSLSTVLIGKDGKVAAWYPSNEWTPGEVLAALKIAANA